MGPAGSVVDVSNGWLVLLGIAALLLVLVIWDITQKKHSILRTWPILGHFRFILELVGPELRQYIVTSNDSERPFSRDQRRWIYSTSKGQDNRFGFGTDMDLELTPNHVIVRPAAFPPQGPVPIPGSPVPVAKILGAHRGRTHAFRPASIVNISGMSFGALSGPAVESLNRGATIGGAFQSTGEGGLSPYHQCGGDLIFQVGTGYFGCRDEKGNFDLARLVAICQQNPVRAIEVKLSQGAKAGLGGMLPAVKVSSEIAAIRGVPAGVDCVSPPYHRAFSDEDSLLDFVERIADATGLPVGIKSAVGDEGFWARLAKLMASEDRGVDFVVIDGGEGGTGAAPLAFTDNVGLPLTLALATVVRIFGEHGINQQVVIAASGRLGLPERGIQAFAIGCDWINVGREVMLSAGCIQSQRCHTDRCPTGVATQNKWLARGIDPASKSERVGRYLFGIREEILALARTAGAVHPAALRPDDVDVLNGREGSRSVAAEFGIAPGWASPSESDLALLMRDWRAAAVPA
ncbi:MAG: FMN-binding glutamate synthase family protein [Actinobacteria bacterium]|uniref:Unannotated protein n=1 Tax=freshwater metagenome TaxID=449393 RepID=A0A6J7CWX6_9ZZZZ|nr:FMN-binding glutamate synthase family protein [Actinomycetota bacterium]